MADTVDLSAAERWEGSVLSPMYTGSEHPGVDRPPLQNAIRGLCDGPTTAALLASCDAILAAHGLSWEGFELSCALRALGRYFGSARLQPEQISDLGTDLLAAVTLDCQRATVAIQLAEAYAPIAAASLLATNNPVQRIEPTSLPLLAAQLSNQGLGSEHVDRAMATWLSYDPLPALGSQRSRTSTEGQVEVAVQRLCGVVTQQMVALSEFGIRYGTQAGVGVVETFGIVNFGRYDARELHQQLTWWSSERGPVRQVELYDLATPHLCGSRSREPWRRGTVRFEVGSAADMAAVGETIGNRERALGRDPHEAHLVDDITVVSDRFTTASLPAGLAKNLGSAFEVDARPMTPRTGLTFAAVGPPPGPPAGIALRALHGRSVQAQR